MKQEDEPVGTGEVVLRLLRPGVLDLNLPFPVSWDAFKPSSFDDDGLSIVREDCISAPTDALLLIEDPEKRRGYSIARVRVAEILRLGCGVVRNQVPNVKGHCLVPELNTVDYKTKALKDRLKVLMVELAKGVTARDIVYRASP